MPHQLVQGRQCPAARHWQSLARQAVPAASLSAAFLSGTLARPPPPCQLTLLPVSGAQLSRQAHPPQQPLQRQRPAARLLQPLHTLHLQLEDGVPMRGCSAAAPAPAAILAAAPAAPAGVATCRAAAAAAASVDGAARRAQAAAGAGAPSGPAPGAGPRAAAAAAAAVMVPACAAAIPTLPPPLLLPLCRSQLSLLAAGCSGSQGALCSRCLVGKAAVQALKLPAVATHKHAPARQLQGWQRAAGRARGNIEGP